MKDPRIGKHCQLHPATDAWMRGDRFGIIVGVGRRVRSFLDPKDPRNGRTLRVRMDRSGRTLRVSEGNIMEVTP